MGPWLEYDRPVRQDRSSSCLIRTSITASLTGNQIDLRFVWRDHIWGFFAVFLNQLAIIGIISARKQSPNLDRIRLSRVYSPHLIPMNSYPFPTSTSIRWNVFGAGRILSSEPFFEDASNRGSL